MVDPSQILKTQVGTLIILIKLSHSPEDAVIIKKFLFLLMEFDGLSLSGTFELN